MGIVGANGSGKTTLLRTIMQRLPPDTGTVRIGASVVVGYYAQEQDTLPLEKTPLEFVRSQYRGDAYDFIVELSLAGGSRLHDGAR